MAVALYGRAMRRAKIVTVVALSLSLAACGGEEEASDPNASGGDGAASGAKKQEPSLKIGDEVTLKGLEGEMKVKMLKIEDPMKAPPTERPRAGRRFVGVTVRFTNPGRQAFKDAPLNGSRLVTNVKKGANPTILLTGKCPSKPGINFRLPAGESKTLCLPFQVKRKAKVTGFQHALNSGFGPDTGKWDVP